MTTWLDIQAAVDRLMNVAGRGRLIGLPALSASSNASGVPTNGLQGWAPSAIWFNYKGSIGSFFYVNTGTFASSTWTNVV